MDLNLSIPNGFVSSNIYNKRDDFTTSKFPFTRRPSYGAYMTQLIRLARVCSHVDDFNVRNRFLTAKLLKQGYRYHNLSLESLFPSSVADTMNWYQNLMSDEDLFYIKAYRNQNFMRTYYTNSKTF